MRLETHVKIFKDISVMNWTEEKEDKDAVEHGTIVRWKEQLFQPATD